MYDAHDALLREMLSRVEFRRMHCQIANCSRRSRSASVPWKGKEATCLLLTRLNSVISMVTWWSLRRHGRIALLLLFEQQRQRGAHQT